MSELVIYFANEKAVRDIVPHLRAADVEELHAAGLGDLAEELVEGVANSVQALVAVVDGKPVALFGLTHLPLAGIFCPWMVGTDYIDKHPLQCLRIAKKIIARWKENGPLVNYVSAKHEKAKRWLAALGFTIDPNPLLVGPHPFQRFYMGVTYV